jgi:hypothetical protein
MRLLSFKTLKKTMIIRLFPSSWASVLLLCSTIPGILVRSFSPSSSFKPHSKLPVLPLPQILLEKHPLIRLGISAASQDEQETRQSSDKNNNNDDDKPDKYDDSIRRGLRRLAQLSLEDYTWRMSVFKEKEASRKMEEYLATMMGEDAAYVRPMDASESKIGPLVSASRLLGSGAIHAWSS